MYKFKKQYAAQTIAYKGRLISAANLTDKIAEEIINKVPALAHYFEKVDSAQASTDPPVTGGGGAGDPRPVKPTTSSEVKKTRTRKA